jgi:FkbM family methyltransferase
MLKRLRCSQPFNAVVTSMVRSVCEVAGRQPHVVVKHLHRIGTARAVLPNGRWLSLWSLGDDWISNQVFWKGWTGYEPETVREFFRLASGARVTLDIGAHVGFYTLVAAHANPGGRVFAFEPHPTVHERLLRNIRANHVSNVECIASAAGVEDGQADLFDPGVAIPSGATMYPTIEDRFSTLVSRRVRVVSLDRFLAARGVSNVDLVKIDTERAEPDVIAGMRETITRDRPAIICEVLDGGDSAQSIVGILAPLGYRYFLLTAAGPRPVHEIRGDPAWRNHLFLPVERCA